MWSFVLRTDIRVGKPTAAGRLPPEATAAELRKMCHELELKAFGSSFLGGPRFWMVGSDLKVDIGFYIEISIMGAREFLEP